MAIRYSFTKDENGLVALADPELKIAHDLAVANDTEVFCTLEARRVAEETLRVAAERLAFDSKRDFTECLKEVFARSPGLAWVSRMRTSPSGTITVHGA